MKLPRRQNQEQIDQWLELLGGPGWKDQEARERASEGMRVIGADTLFPLLIPKLNLLVLVPRER